MPVYRVNGADRYRRDTPRTVYVEAADKPDAVREAIRRGVVGGRIEEISLEQVPEGERLHHAGAAAAAADSALLREPVKTIATGVFWGLVLFTIAAAIFNLVLMLIGMGVDAIS